MTGNESSQSRRLFTPPRYLLGRLYLLAVVLTLDCVALAAVPHNSSLLGPVAPAGIAAFAVFLGLGHSRLKSRKEKLRFSWLLFSVHFVLIATAVACNVVGLHGPSLFSSRPAHLALSGVVVSAIALLALACVPLAEWIATIRSTTSLWIAALLAGIAAGFLRHPFQLLWNIPAGVALQAATFHAAQTFLRPLLPNLIADPANFILGTPSFLVFIAPECSGLEGLGLVLVFTLVWLWYFRSENRFPHALLLIPCALASVWLLNILRIAAIILIGNAGAPDVAMIGFHSQAGWITFTAVALLFSMATRKIAWVRREPVSAAVADTSSEIAGQGESSATAAFLVPYLAILAASFVSRAASGSFELLYPLRFVAGLIAIWWFRREYREQNWDFGWIGPITGAIVFLVWIAQSMWSRDASTTSVAVALAGLSPVMRTAWIVTHVAAAITTVPIAEELAFRGYLARRLIGREFDSVSYSRLTLVSIGVSSLACGAMQGKHWMVGTLSGAAYGLLLKRTGRIANAIVAHATTSLLLAAWVILSGNWRLW